MEVTREAAAAAGAAIAASGAASAASGAARHCGATPKSGGARSSSEAAATKRPRHQDIESVSEAAGSNQASLSTLASPGSMHISRCTNVGARRDTYMQHMSLTGDTLHFCVDVHIRSSLRRGRRIIPRFRRCLRTRRRQRR